MNRSGIGVKLLAVSIVAILAMTAYYAVESAGESDVVVIFTNDVHCGYDENIGYDGLVAYKKEMEKECNNVLLVDSGDYLQGAPIGLIGDGALIAHLMNEVGYDIVTIGNHDFDYGADNLWTILKNCSFESVCCNISYTGEKHDPLGFMQPFTIREFDALKIAFIGVATPTTKNTTAPSNLEEDGKIVYNFSSGNDGKDLYDSVQRSIDASRAMGANKVILLSHLGDSESPPYTSVEVAANTSGLSCILDGHQHSVINETVKDKDGKDVRLASTGTKFANIGCLKITQKGDMSVKLVSSSDYTKKDPEMKKVVDYCTAVSDEMLGKPIIELPVDMLDHNADGARTVRNQETTIGNMIADAYRIQLQTDIALFGGGGIRGSLYEGKVSTYDLLKVLPYQDPSAVVEVTGQIILYDLEMSCYKMTTETSSGSTALGEFGGFQSVSGITFKVNTDIESPVIVDEDGNYVGLKSGAPCRVSDVKVLNKTTGQYEALDVNKKYTVGGTDFLLLECGDGFTMFKDAKVISPGSTMDIILVEDYVNSLTQEQLSEMYSETQGRIVRISA